MLELAILALGRLAMQHKRTARLTSAEVTELHQVLFECLEVLNNEKETYRATR